MNTPESGPRVIVEIGAGRYDIADQWQSLAATRSFAPEEIYIGMDIGERARPIAYSAVDPEAADRQRDTASKRDSQMRLGWAALQESRPEEAIAFVQADAQHMPLPDESADEVIGVNVLGRGIRLGNVLRAAIRESHRVMKPDARLVFYDFITPRFVDGWALSGWINKAPNAPGFSTRLITPESPNDWYSQAIEQYGLVDTRGKYSEFGTDATIWILRKSESWPGPPRPLQ